MNLIINKNLNIPAYVQLKTQIRLALNGGELNPGKLAGLRKMASEAGVSRGTMARAVKELSREGLLETKPRSGTYLYGDAADPRPKIILLEKNNLSQSYLTTLLQTGGNRIERFASAKCEKRYFHGDELSGAVIRMSARLHPAVMIVDAAWMTQDRVYEFLDLPFPVCFIGDFVFGELRDPRLNQVRENTEERGSMLVRAANDVGCRDICICGATQDQYYIEMLKRGVAREAEAHRIRVRYESEYYSDMIPATERLGAIRRNIAAMAAEGFPDGIVADNHIVYAELREALREYGVQLGRDLKFLTPLRLLDDSDMIDDGYLIQYNHRKVGDRIEQIVERLICERKEYHAGIVTITGEVGYSLSHVKNVTVPAVF